jgi:hypothetical protein
VPNKEYSLPLHYILPTVPLISKPDRSESFTSDQVLTALRLRWNAIAMNTIPF